MENSRHQFRKGMQRVEESKEKILHNKKQIKNWGSELSKSIVDAVAIKMSPRTKGNTRVSN